MWPTRPLTPLVVTILMVLAAFAVDPAPGARACSLIPPLYALTRGDNPSVVVAVGVVTRTTSAVAEFTVEDALRGAANGDRITINNRVLGLGAGCEVYVEPGAQGGQRFELGERALVALQEDDLGSGAQYRPSHYGFAVFHLDGQALVDEWNSARLPREIDIIDRIRGAVGPATEKLEEIPPCNPPYGDLVGVIPTFVAASRIVVRGSFVAAGPDVATFQVMVTFHGAAAPGDLQVNNRTMHARHDGRCGVEMSEYQAFKQGGDVILFLVPDEFGLADWRVAVWGSAAFGVGDGKVARYPGPVLLADIRTVLGPLRPGAVGANPVGSPVDGTTVRGGTAGPWSWILVAIGLCALAGATVLVAVRLRR